MFLIDKKIGLVIPLSAVLLDLFLLLFSEILNIL